jgi:hypothetical protein
VPRLVQAQDDYFLEGLVVVGLADGSPDKVRGFIAEHGVSYPVLLASDELIDAWEIDLIWGSEIYLVDPEGLVVARGLEDAEARLADELGG